MGHPLYPEGTVTIVLGMRDYGMGWRRWPYAFGASTIDVIKPLVARNECAPPENLAGRLISRC
jgi:hypothetical protein